LSIILILVGIVILISNILYYPLSLPNVITSENSQWIQSSSYIFYIIFVSSIVIEIIAIRKTINLLALKYKEPGYKSTNIPSTLSTISKSNPLSHKDKEYLPISLWKILFNMITDKSSSFFFLPITITYGLFYALISSTLIIRFDGSITHMSGIEKFPTIIMMQYGPVGYTPSISIYLNDNVGILIIPINIIIILIISTLVGLNVISSIYAIKVYISEKKRTEKTSISPVFKNGAKFLGILGATTSLFTACPTCASFYLFSILSGSLATTIASFTVNYYVLFLSLSIPLLIITPMINSFNIKRMIINNTNQCKIKKKK
jgi:hypothetical protein